MMALGQTVHADMEDDPLVTMLLMDRFEVLNNDENTRVWEGSFWIGYDINKFYLYSEGEATSDGLESSQNELVYSRAIAAFWDAQIGLVYDKNADASQTWGEIAISGLAPYYFETRTALLVNGDANVGLRLDAEYEAEALQNEAYEDADFFKKLEKENEVYLALCNDILELGNYTKAVDEIINFAKKENLIPDKVIFATSKSFRNIPNNYTAHCKNHKFFNFHQTLNFSKTNNPSNKR